jgi:hypothetical protein
VAERVYIVIYSVYQTQWHSSTGAAEAESTRKDTNGIKERNDETATPYSNAVRKHSVKEAH